MCKVIISLAMVGIFVGVFFVIHDARVEGIMRVLRNNWEPKEMKLNGNNSFLKHRCI